MSLKHITDSDFYIACDKRDFDALAKYDTLNTEIESETICNKAVICLMENDIELLKNLRFPTRWVLKLVANKPVELERLLKILDTENTDIPSYVWERVTSETIPIFEKYYTKSQIQFADRRINPPTEAVTESNDTSTDSDNDKQSKKSTKKEKKDKKSTKKEEKDKKSTKSKKKSE